MQFMFLHCLMSNFADDNFAIHWSENIDELVMQMEHKLKVMISWLTGSVLKVNEGKTEILQIVE